MYEEESDEIHKESSVTLRVEITNRQTVVVINLDQNIQRTEYPARRTKYGGVAGAEYA